MKDVFEPLLLTIDDNPYVDPSGGIGGGNNNEGGDGGDWSGDDGLGL